MLAGLLRPDAGTVVLDGVDVTREPLFRRARRGLGYLAQEPSVFRGLSVEDNLALVLEVAGVEREEAKRRADALLGDMGLQSIRSAVARSLSGGERRRLEVARVLALRPSIVLLDEPFTGLDPKGIDELKRWIREMASRRIGVFLTDHNVHEWLELCDLAYLMADGRILARGRPEDIAGSAVARDAYFGPHSFGD